ncbi:hypothetical protein JCM1841_004412 [Sporobolomyces salmonicolor]
MPDPVKAYLQLSPAQQQQPEHALPALSSLLHELSTGQEPVPEQRRKLVAALLSSAPASADSPLLAPLCSLLKLLGRSPAGSEELGRENGLRILLLLGGLKRVADLPRPDKPVPRDDDDEMDPALAAQGEADPLKPAESEALRCLCNTLMLHPSSREVFPDVLLADDKGSALKGMVRILGCDGAGFLGGRLLFLLTSKASEAVGELVLAGEVVEILQEFANRYLVLSKSPVYGARLTNGPLPTASDILREHLKLAYNLMLQYSRHPSAVPEGFTAGKTSPSLEKKKKRFWGSSSEKKDKAFTPSLATSEPGVDDLEGAAADDGAATDSHKEPGPRSKSPMSLAKRVVGAVTGGSHSSSSSLNVHSTSSSASATPGPSSPALTATASLSGTPAAASPSPSAAAVAAQEGTSPDSLSLASSQLFLPVFRPYLALAVTLPLLPPGTSPKDPNPTVRSALNTLLNFPLELEELDGSQYSWVQYIPPRTDAQGIVERAGGMGSLGERLLELVHTTCDAYFPVEGVPPNPKQYSSKEKRRKLEPPVHPDEWIPTGQGEPSKIEEMLGPIMLLLRKMSMLGDANEAFRRRIFPRSIDRSLPLDRHSTLTGHLVRLLSSILLPNTAYGVGEFLYNLCDRDPEKLCHAIGYGNASGFLQNRGELIPPPPRAQDAPTAPPAGTSTAPPRPVNPITGAFDPPEDPDDVPMSEAEKEREAERLYTLFDRMSRSGVLSAENPVHRARSEGRFEDTSEQRERELERIRRDEEELEKEVERDMQEWRARRNRTAAPS